MNIGTVTVTMNNWIVESDHSILLGISGENAVARLDIITTVDAGWIYMLEIEHLDRGEKNIIPLTAETNKVYAVLTSEMLGNRGGKKLQIRAINGEQVKKSNVFRGYVNNSVNASENIPEHEKTLIDRVIDDEIALREDLNSKADASEVSRLSESIVEIGTKIFSKNLYNQNNIKEGYWITGTGELISQPDYGGYVTEEIPVEKGRNLFISGLNGSTRMERTCTRARTLDANKNVLRVLNAISSVDVLTSESYVQFLFANAQKSVQLQIEYDRITDYEQYKNAYYKKACTEEEFDEFFERRFSKNLINYDEWQDGKWINADGTIVTNSYGGTVITVEVEQNRPMYMTYNDASTAMLSTVRYATYDENKEVINVYSGTIDGFVCNDGCKYLSICLGVASKENHVMLSYDYPMGYVEYKESELTAKEEKFPEQIYVGVGMFSSIGAIGDSYTQGSVKNSSGTWSQATEQSYIAVMAKRFGVSYSNYGLGGSDTKTYQTDSNGLAKVLADSAKDFYVFAFGINDTNRGANYIGNISDMHDGNPSQNADTFYGNYGKIIEAVKGHAPKAKFVILKTFMNTNRIFDAYNEAIENIASYYGIPCINPRDDKFFESKLWFRKVDSHPTTQGYCGIGLALERLLSKAIMENEEYFLFSVVG